MACYNMCKGEWPRRACTVRYFSNVFTCKRLCAIPWYAMGDHDRHPRPAVDDVQRPMWVQ